MIDRPALDDVETLGTLADRLHHAWVSREPVIIELGVGAAELRRPEQTTLEPWRLRRGFSFNRERLHFLVWANSYDRRDGEGVWWWGRKAVAIGADIGEDADVVLPDGRSAWIDGGTRGPLPDLGHAVIHAETVTLGKLTTVPPLTATALADLAPDQAAAAGHTSGPARIIAPAGSW